MAGMVLIEVHLGPGIHELTLSEEVLRETSAQIMTHELAAKAGFQGLPKGLEGREVRYIALKETDSRWVLNALEANPNVSNMRVHPVG
jgi:hypothetical protein